MTLSYLLCTNTTELRATCAALAMESSASDSSDSEASQERRKSSSLPSEFSRLQGMYACATRGTGQMQAAKDAGLQIAQVKVGNVCSMHA